MRYFDAYRMEKWLFTRCGECGAVVAEVDQETHTEWHGSAQRRVEQLRQMYSVAIGANITQELLDDIKRPVTPWGPDHPDYDEMGQ